MRTIPALSRLRRGRFLPAGRAPRALWEPANCRLSDASRAAIADGHFPAVDDDGDGPSAAGRREHLFQASGILLHVEILDPSLRIGLTGRGGVGSALFSVDLDFLCFDVICHE